MRLYYLLTDHGCGIRAAKNLTQARAAALREVGTLHFRSIRRATDDDVAWVQAMGGHVPEGAVDKVASS